MHPKLEIFLRALWIRILRADRIRVMQFVFFFMGFLLFVTAGRYMLIEGSFYTALADKQQQTKVPIPVNRGLISTSNTPMGILGTSAELADIAIDPQAKGNKAAAIGLLAEMTHEQLCARGKNCEENLARFLKKHEIPDYDGTHEAAQKLISAEIESRINKKWVSGVLIKEGLSDAEKAAVAPLMTSGLYFVLNNLYVDPESLPSGTNLAQSLSSLLGIEQERMKLLLSLRPSRYEKIVSRLDAPLKEKLDARIFEEQEAVRKKLLKVEDAAYPFIIADYQSTRFYPDHGLASQVVGFVDHDGVGQYGIEGYFNHELAGKAGFGIVRKDIQGRPIRDFEDTEEQQVVGSSFRLTIDRNIQKEVERILETSVKEYRANRASAVVLDPKTGAIRAMANYPSFDPNSFGDVYDLERFYPERLQDPLMETAGMPVFVEDTKNGKEFIYRGQKKSLREATIDEIVLPGIAKYRYKNGLGPAAYANYAISSLYEPGSVFKAFTVAIGLDLEEIRPQDRYEDKGFVEIDRFKINNLAKDKCGGYQTFLNALNWSCNVGMIEIVKKIGPANFWRYLKDFGLGERSDITLEGEIGGKIDPWQRWSRTQLFTSSFGQGVTATILQMAAAYAVLANGGVYMQPYIVAEKTLPNGKVIEYQPRALRRVLKETTSQTISAMLTRGVEDGFAKKGGVAGYDVAGKTGTSQIASRGGYEKSGVGHTVTSFGGFAPSGNPKFVLIVQVERPRTSQYSEGTSSSMFSQVAKYLLSYYSIPKKTDISPVANTGSSVKE